MAVGLKVTLMVHWAFGAIEVPQLFVCAKGAAVWMLEMVRVPVWLFNSVIAYEALVVLIPWLGNAISLGETEMFCACSPAQESKTSERKPLRLLNLKRTGNPLGN